MICHGCSTDKHCSYFTRIESGRYKKLCKRCDMKPRRKGKKLKDVQFNFTGFELLVHRLATNKWEIGRL